MKSTISKLLSKLRNPEYRKAYVASQISVGIPFQIRSLLKSHGLTQEQLAKQANMLQPRISKLLNPGAMEPNIRTLRRIAEAFDCGLMVRFVPFSELVLRSERFDPESFTVQTFEQEDSKGRFKQIESHLANGAIPILIDGTNITTEVNQQATAETDRLESLPPLRENISLTQPRGGNLTHVGTAQ
ncbi:MAG: helix-turn-helix transcriptional regulator [Acidobacteria bacterium]|nr:helix-turn-helix transcriptional regulator [Acidobacteriota bacterium]